MNRLVIGSGLLMVAVTAACPRTQTQVVPMGPGASPGATSGPQVVDVVDENGRTFKISQGERGDPTTIGCADGQREAFVDLAASPNVAGCIAEWDGKQSLRAVRTTEPCGDDGNKCAVPGDACALGWHMCGDAGNVAEVEAITPAACEQAGGGRFVAAISHCKTQDSNCQYEPAATANYECFESGWCSEPVCCGSDCGEFGVCRDGVWPGMTHIPVGTDQGCGSVGSSRARGVLCCK